MVIRESAEDYLETILVLKNRLGNVRSIDIAHELSFSKPSVSVAMKNLRLNNYITVDEWLYQPDRQWYGNCRENLRTSHIPDKFSDFNWGGSGNCR